MIGNVQGINPMTAQGKQITYVKSAGWKNTKTGIRTMRAKDIATPAGFSCEETNSDDIFRMMVPFDLSTESLQNVSGLY